VEENSVTKDDRGCCVERFAGSLVRRHFDIIILQFINSEPMHGYQIINNICKKFDVSCGPSSIYPMLKSFEKNGLVESKWDTTRYKMPRKMYHLTAKGQSVLKNMIETLKTILQTLPTSEATPKTKNNSN
jgi:DNA-binding PadR family transcriptional regulator